MKFCCTAFEYFAGMAGARGFGIFTTKSLNPKGAFVLQHRALDEGAPGPDSPSRMSIVSELQSQICPWCGVNLMKIYRQNLDELDRSDLKISLD
jgi:hypothetical protein